jgi:hypothetical protein
MIVEKSNDDFNKLVEVLWDIKNKEIFQSYHTYGTMFLFDLGQKTEKFSQGKLGFIGENTVIVENDTWSLLKKETEIVHSKDEIKEIRKLISGLVGNKIIDFSFVHEEKLFTITFANDFRLEVTLSGSKYRDIGIKLSNGNWIDIGPGNTWKEVTGDHVDE